MTWEDELAAVLRDLEDWELAAVRQGMGAACSSAVTPRLGRFFDVLERTAAEEARRRLEEWRARERDLASDRVAGWWGPGRRETKDELGPADRVLIDPNGTEDPVDDNACPRCGAADRACGCGVI